MRKRQNTITVEALVKNREGYRWREKKIINYKTRQNL